MPSRPTCCNLDEIVPADFDAVRRQHRRRCSDAQPQRHDDRRTACGAASSGKPDVQGSACMKDCATEVKVASVAAGLCAQRSTATWPSRSGRSVPYRGIDTTQLRAGKRAVAAAAGAGRRGRTARRRRAGADRRNACTACHGVDSKIVGPAFREVGAKYASRSDARGLPGRRRSRRAAQGVWGAVPMPPQPYAQGRRRARRIAQWILAGRK